MITTHGLQNTKLSRLGKLILLVLFLPFLAFAQAEKDLTPWKKYAPKSYEVFEKFSGDIGNDGSKEAILILKATLPKYKKVKNMYDHFVDRNRRGILILTPKNGTYEKTFQKLNCFTSENEEGGVYFPPDLYIEVEKGNLLIEYLHGRYGYWHYIFRPIKNDFELIGYESSDNHGPITQTMYSANFITGQLKISDNINKDKEDAEEKFVDKWTKFPKQSLKKLSQIDDFDALDEWTNKIIYH